jgi:hypothetical protein
MASHGDARRAQSRSPPGDPVCIHDLVPRDQFGIGAPVASVRPAGSRSREPATAFLRRHRRTTAIGRRAGTRREVPAAPRPVRAFVERVLTHPNPAVPRVTCLPGRRLRRDRRSRAAAGARVGEPLASRTRETAEFALELTPRPRDRRRETRKSSTIQKLLTGNVFWLASGARHIRIRVEKRLNVVCLCVTEEPRNLPSGGITTSDRAKLGHARYKLLRQRPAQIDA